MKIVLLKNIGKHGVILDWKKLLRDTVEFDIEESGVLTVGARLHRAVNGHIVFPEYDILLGTNKVTFTASDGTVYECGKISRSGRFIEVVNPVDELTVNIALAYERQAGEISELRARLEEIQTERGIKIV